MSNKQHILLGFKTNNTEHENMFYNRADDNDQQGGRCRSTQQKLDLKESPT